MTARQLDIKEEGDLMDAVPEKMPSNFEHIGKAIGELVAEKDAAYGDAFGKTGDFLQIMYPDGIAPDKYQDALCLVRIFDKMMRIATDKDALGESPYSDIAGYGILGVAMSAARLSEGSQ